VEQTFSEHKWKSWKFKPVPNGFWEDTKNHQKFVEWLGHHLGFKKMEDWYKLSGKDVEENGGDGLLSKFGISPNYCKIYIQNTFGLLESLKQFLKEH